MRTSPHRSTGLGMHLCGLASVLVVTSCESPSDPATDPGAAGPRFAVTAAASNAYLILGGASALPPELDRRIAAIGGRITMTFPEIGVAVAVSERSDFTGKASRIDGVLGIAPDLVVHWIPDSRGQPGPTLQEVSAWSSNVIGNPPASGDDDFFFDLQWGAAAVSAPVAWNAGARGAGTRVAILDTGIDFEHPDLAPNVNTALSTSFVPGEGPNAQFSFHGTHVAGIVAAADNAFGIIGIAPEAEIVGVKVVSDSTGSGPFDWLIAGILYAAAIDADVINMSLSTAIPILRRGIYDEHGNRLASAAEVALLYKALSRATTYAYQNGTLVIAAAGNDARNGNADRDLLVLPADAEHTLSISATGPLGWGVDASTDLDVPAFYTNYGASVIDFAAPGGNLDFGLIDSGQECTVVIPIPIPCFNFDLVFSTVPGGYAWAAGTSMAAPHASGVAAIIISGNGGSMDPAQVEAALRSLADDLGKPGHDPYYGSGRVSAAQAMQ